VSDRVVERGRLHPRKKSKKLPLQSSRTGNEARRKGRQGV
jgi:hypothetical protein